MVVGCFAAYYRVSTDKQGCFELKRSVKQTGHGYLHNSLLGISLPTGLLCTRDLLHVPFWTIAI